MYNNNLSSTIDMSSFFANKGYYFSLQVQIICKLTSKLVEILIADLENTYTRLK